VLQTSSAQGETKLYPQIVEEYPDSSYANHAKTRFAELEKAQEECSSTQLVVLRERALIINKRFDPSTTHILCLSESRLANRIQTQA